MIIRIIAARPGCMRIHVSRGDLVRPRTKADGVSESCTTAASASSAGARTVSIMAQPDQAASTFRSLSRSTMAFRSFTVGAFELADAVGPGLGPGHRDVVDRLAHVEAVAASRPEASRAIGSCRERGQSPAVMVIGCCNSRVSPEVIFDAGPGELFVVRNVADLVPLYQPDSGAHGVSAALEYAVNVLRIQHIVVLGHAQCGGIRAFIDKIDPLSESDFIGRWMAMFIKPGEVVEQRDRDDDAGFRRQDREGRRSSAASET